MQKVMCFSLVVFLLLTVPSCAESFKGRVIQVITGNIIVVAAIHRTYDIKLCSIDSPDLEQDMGLDAREFTEALLLHKDVWVDVHSFDHSRRSIATVLVDHKDASVEIARAGFAWFDSRCTSKGCVAEAEADAKTEKTGLWSAENPRAPWDFRRVKRNIHPDESGECYALPAPSSGTAYGFVPVSDQGCESCFKVYVPIMEWDGSVSGYTEY